MFAQFFREPLSAKLFQAIDLGDQVRGAKVEVKVHAILALLGFWDVLQEKSWCGSGPNQAEVGRSVEAAPVVQRGKRGEPKARLRFSVKTVQRHNDLHGGTVGGLVRRDDPFPGSTKVVLLLFSPSCRERDPRDTPRLGRARAGVRRTLAVALAVVQEHAHARAAQGGYGAWEGGAFGLSGTDVRQGHDRQIEAEPFRQWPEHEGIGAPFCAPSKPT